jgi:hypothetical protein
MAAEQWALLNEEPLPERYNRFAVIAFDQEARQLWDRHGEAITDRWIKERPGTRPQCWWRFWAPRMRGEWLARLHAHGFARLEECPQPRAIVSGDGEPALALLFDHGIPALWNRVNAVNPPLLESEAAYLRQFGLLDRREARRVKPTSFLPQLLPQDLWPQMENS